jgi:fatty-acyl-CoA synthase
MMASGSDPPASPSARKGGVGDPGSGEESSCLPRVLEVTRTFALECGGPRALQAVTPGASLVRDLGLGSLEQVELRFRLEEAFGVQLPDEMLGMDSPAELAEAVARARVAEPTPPPAAPAPLPLPGGHRAEGAVTLHEALQRWAEAEATRPHVYLRQDDGSFTTLTYGELWDGANAVAGGILRHGRQPGETVALMLPTGADFLRTFMGILLAGAIPVPLYPPFRMAGLEDYLRRQAGILDNATARLLVTTREVMPVARVLRGTLGSAFAMTTAEALARGGGPVNEVAGSSVDPALIQYTSGSTGAPKGVLLSHGALLSNIRAIAGHLRMSPTDVGVSWLPLYHDMGLIGTWLNCLCHGVPLVLMPPLSFLARPDLWLWTIHRYRATLSAAPNFGYELCARRIPDERLEGLDLSSWRCALNGAEPVSADTVDRFSRRFGSYGFRPEALIPAYGLAESAVALSLSPLERNPVVDRLSRGLFELEGRAEPARPGERSPLRFVSMGSPLPHHEVRIVDDRGEPLPDGRVGRLFFRGPSSMDGYFQRPDVTRETVLPGGWIDTGDLAYRKAGELYVTGRRKDLIIKAGRNLVPEDIEALVAAVEGIRKGCVAAFGVSDPRTGTERLVVVAEVRATAPEELRSLETAVFSRLSEAIDLPPDQVILLPPRSIPKTSSGKIRRSEAREWFEAGRLGVPEEPSVWMRLELLKGGMTRFAASAWAGVRRTVYLAYLVAAAPATGILLVLPAWGLAAVLPGRRPALVIERVVTRIALRIAGVRASVECEEELPERGPIILTSNHTSYVDTVVLLAHLPLDFRIVAKKEVLAWPLIGTFVRRAGHPTVDRWDFRKSVEDRRAIAHRLAAGDAVLFFPEGTFVRAVGLRPFRLGAFETAVETGTPIIPIALRGTRRTLPPGEAWPRPGRVSLWIGPAMAPEGKGWPAVIQLRNRVFNAIAAHCGEPKLETFVGGPIPQEPAS